MSKAEQQLAEETLAILRHQAQATTELMARLGGQIINNVLEVFSGTFPAAGYFARGYGVAIGAVTVDNLAAAATLVTVSSAGPSDSAPSGVGTYVIDGGQCRTVPIGGRQVTIYGTEGQRFCFIAYTAAARPVTGG